jgi:hypothetical protein
MAHKMKKLIIPSGLNNQLECWPPDDDDDKTALIISVTHPGYDGKRSKTVRTHFFLAKQEVKKLGEHLIKISES